MLATIWTRRREYDLAQVDVYSGAAFFWAEAVAFALRRARQTLRSDAARRRTPPFRPPMARRVRASSHLPHAVTAPSGFLVEECARYRADLRLIPNAIDVARYPFRLRDHPAPRARLAPRLSQDLRPHSRHPRLRAASRAHPRRDARHGRPRQTRRQPRASPSRRRRPPASHSTAACRKPKSPLGSTAATSF